MDSFLFWATVVLGGFLAILVILALILFLHLKTKKEREKEVMEGEEEEGETPAPPKKDRWWASSTAIAGVIYLILWGVAGYLIPHVLAAFSFGKFAILFFGLPLIVWVWKKPYYGKGLAIFAGVLLLVMLFQTGKQIGGGIDKDFGATVAAITGYNTEIAGEQVLLSPWKETEVPLNGFQCMVPAETPPEVNLKVVRLTKEVVSYTVAKTFSLAVWRFNRVADSDCKGSAVTLAPFFQTM